MIQVSPFTEYGVSSTTILIRITAWSVDLAEASVTKAPFIVKRRQLHLFPVFPFTKYYVSSTIILIWITAWRVDHTFISVLSTKLWLEGKVLML